MPRTTITTADGTELSIDYTVIDSLQGGARRTGKFRVEVTETGEVVDVGSPLHREAFKAVNARL